MKIKDLHNEVVISFWPDEEGAVNLSLGWNFGDEVSEETVDHFRQIAAGIYGLVTARMSDVLSVGSIVEATSDFGSAMDNDDDEMELVFTPDDDLLDEISGKEDAKVNKVVDLKDFKVNPNKTTKH